MNGNGGPLRGVLGHPAPPLSNPVSRGLETEVLSFAERRERAEAFATTARDACLRLRARRRVLGLSQSHVARRLGVTQGHFSKCERGVDFPSLPLWLAWCALLGVEAMPPRAYADV